MVAKLRALRTLLAALLIAGALSVALTPQPAAAYYGEVEGYIGFWNGSFGGQGCEGVITVLYGKRVQMFCQVQNGNSGVVANSTNWTEYSCWQWDGCVYYYRINGWSGWHPLGTWSMKKTDYGGLHALINWASPR
jgi:hypothetical protein